MYLLPISLIPETKDGKERIILLASLTVNILKNAFLHPLNLGIKVLY